MPTGSVETWTLDQWWFVLGCVAVIIVTALLFASSEVIAEHPLARAVTGWTRAVLQAWWHRIMLVSPPSMISSLRIPTIALPTQARDDVITTPHQASRGLSPLPDPVRLDPPVQTKPVGVDRLKVATLNEWWRIVSRFEQGDPQHVRIIGPTDSGKSVMAQAIAAGQQGKLLILDPVWKPGNWNGLPAITVTPAGDYDPIEDGLHALMREMEQRGGKLQEGVTTFERLTILFDEIPDTVSEVEIAGKVIRRLGQRGRHGNMHLVGMAQSERVRSWGIDGYGDTARNFVDILLGSSAIEAFPESAKLERPAVIRWHGMLTARYGLPDPLMIDVTGVMELQKKFVGEGRVFQFTTPTSSTPSLEPDTQRLLNFLQAWESDVPPTKAAMARHVWRRTDRNDYPRLDRLLLLLREKRLVDAENRPIEEEEEA